MTLHQQNDQYLRKLARDVRFLKYRAGAPHPIMRGIFLVMLLPFLFIAVIGFFIEGVFNSTSSSLYRNTCKKGKSSGNISSAPSPTTMI